MRLVQSCGKIEVLVVFSAIKDETAKMNCFTTVEIVKGLVAGNLPGMLMYSNLHGVRDLDRKYSQAIKSWSMKYVQMYALTENVM